jgi:hypothetical protein
MKISVIVHPNAKQLRIEKDATIFHKFFLVVFICIMAVALYLKKDSFLTPSYTVNLHMHTTCSDGKNSYDEMIEAAVKLKIDFVALTDHTICPENTAKCVAETRILCMPGQEVTGERTHLLALNVQQYINQDMPIERQVSKIHSLGGFAIAAHPNAKDFLYTDQELINNNIDAMECTSNINERRPLPCVYDSDAHNAYDLGWQFMSCSMPVNSFEDIKTAILSKKCFRSTALPFATPVNAKIY